MPVLKSSFESLAITTKSTQWYVIISPCTICIMIFMYIIYRWSFEQVDHCTLVLVVYFPLVFVSSNMAIRHVLVDATTPIPKRLSTTNWKLCVLCQEDIYWISTGADPGGGGPGGPAPLFVDM